MVKAEDLQSDCDDNTGSWLLCVLKLLTLFSVSGTLDFGWASFMFMLSLVDVVLSRRSQVGGHSTLSFSLLAVGSNAHVTKKLLVGTGFSRYQVCVQASLSVAMGQRAPNRAGVTEDVSQRVQRRDDLSNGRRPASGRPRDDDGLARPRERERQHDRLNQPAGQAEGGGAGERHWAREHDRDRNAERDRDRDRRGWGNNSRNSAERDAVADGRDRRHGYDRDGRDARDRDGGRGRGAWNSRDVSRGGGGGRARDWRSAREPARERDRGPQVSSVFGRSAADVFGKCKVPEKNAGSMDKFSGDGAAAMGYTAPVGHAEEVVRIGRRR